MIIYLHVSYLPLFCGLFFQIIFFSVTLSLPVFIHDLNIQEQSSSQSEANVAVAFVLKLRRPHPFQQGCFNISREAERSPGRSVSAPALSPAHLSPRHCAPCRLLAPRLLVKCEPCLLLLGNRLEQQEPLQNPELYTLNIFLITFFLIFSFQVRNRAYL